MFNTGSVVGVFANIYDAGFPPKFIPSFSWGGKSGFVKNEFKKAIEVAKTFSLHLRINPWLRRSGPASG